MPLEQPCAGNGTCGKCRVLVEAGIAPPGDIELRMLTPEELALNKRLACCARVADDAVIVLAPVTVHSAKAFHASDAYKTRLAAPLGMAIDLGSTTVAAFLTVLDTGEVCAGAASLNQQSVYGADVISRLAAAQTSAQDQRRLRDLAIASIDQAVQALDIPRAVRRRIQRVCVVGNPAMHHLLLGLPVEKLATLPFRADAVIYAKSSYNEVRLADGVGGFGSPTAGAITEVGTGNVRELVIPWSTIHAGGRPASFSWLGYATSGSGYVYGEMPPTNGGGNIGTSASFSHFYRVTDATPASGTKPFSLDSTP